MGKKIYIDAGHNYSGGDTGATGNGLREQDITFYIAANLQAILNGAGFETKMSRPTLASNVGTDVASSINGRVNAANSWGADLLVSIHCNSGGGTGTETLCYTLGGKSGNLAEAVQKRVVSEMGTVNRGVKIRPDLGVLRLTDMPAIMVETAFIDNAADAALLRDRQADFAKAICDGICEYLGVQPMPRPSQDGGETVMPNEITDAQEAINTLREKAGLSEATMQFLLAYKFAEPLVLKLANAMR